MKKETLIGAVIGIIISIVGGVLSLDSQAIKDAVCQAPSVQVGK